MQALSMRQRQWGNESKSDKGWITVNDDTDARYASEYHVPRPAPWRTRCPLWVSALMWPLIVLRLAPVALVASLMVTRP